jgi:hypothetical protein
MRQNAQREVIFPQRTWLTSCGNDVGRGLTAQRPGKVIRLGLLRVSRIQPAHMRMFL